MDSEQLKSFARRYGPDILSGLATVGVGLTAWLSGRAAIKINDKINEPIVTYYDNQRCEFSKTKKQKFKETWKYYIPPVVSGILTVASIWGSRKMSAGQVASMAAAAGYFMNARKKAIKDDVSKIDPPVSVEETGHGDVLCFEAFSGRWFRSSVEAVEEACRILNDIYKHDLEEKGYSALTLNELYSLLDIQTTYFGDKVIWCNEENGDQIVFANEFIEWHDDGIGTVYVLTPIQESMPTMTKVDY